jgi:hypothetical protein
MGFPSIGYNFWMAWPTLNEGQRKGLGPNYVRGRSTDDIGRMSLKNE